MRYRQFRREETVRLFPYCSPRREQWAEKNLWCRKPGCVEMSEKDTERRRGPRETRREMQHREYHRGSARGNIVSSPSPVSEKFPYSVTTARPKTVTFPCSPPCSSAGVRRMQAGDMPRCATPCSCKNAKACPTSLASSSAPAWRGRGREIRQGRTDARWRGGRGRGGKGLTGEQTPRSTLLRPHLKASARNPERARPGCVLMTVSRSWQVCTTARYVVRLG